MVRVASNRFCASVHDGPVAAALGRSGRAGPPHGSDVCSPQWEMQPQARERARVTMVTRLCARVEHVVLLTIGRRLGLETQVGL